MPGLPAFSWCLLSSLLLWLSFFPVNAGWLGWVALVPLIFVLESYVRNSSDQPPSSSLTAAMERPRWFHRPLLCAWLGGLAFCLMAFRWIILASTPMIAVYLALALIISLQWYLFFLFTRLLVQSIHLPLLLAAPCVWTALEYIRSQIYIGYSWYSLGHTQHEELTLLQIADLMGVYGISFLVMMVNVALARILWHRRLGNITRELVPCGILVGLACWYGQEQLAADAEILHRPQTPRIAVLQGNQPQDLRNDPHQWRKIDEVYFRLGEEASRYQPELIIAPETCISVSWVRLKEGKLPTWLGELQEPKLPFDRMAANAQAWTSFHTRRWQADLFFGFNCWDLTGTSLRHTNSALLISREGEELAHYDKIICLPFGEYIPCAETLPFMKWLSPYPFEYTVRCGESIHSIPWRNYRIGTLICYEDSAHDLCRAFLLRTNPSFWINISNDGWFKGSEEHEQHLVSARFRCVETRRSMVRAVNMGISCIMDAMGRIIAFPARSPLPENHPGAVSALDLKGSDWHTAKNHEGILIGSVPIYEGLSPYTQFGDLLPWLCWAVMILAWFMSVYRNCKKA